MTRNLRVDERFVQGEAWEAAAGRYEAFVQQAVRGPAVLLELGVGFNTPGIIRFPFERMVLGHSQATLVRVNKRDAGHPAELDGRAITFREEMAAVVGDLAG
jgi:hypothetical protein